VATGALCPLSSQRSLQHRCVRVYDCEHTCMSMYVCESVCVRVQRVVHQRPFASVSYN